MKAVGFFGWVAVCLWSSIPSQAETWAVADSPTLEPLLGVGYANGLHLAVGGRREVIFGIKPQNHIDASRLSGAARRDDSGQQKNQPEPLKCFHEPIDRRIGARAARTNAYPRRAQGVAKSTGKSVNRGISNYSEEWKAFVSGPPYCGWDAVVRPSLMLVKSWFKFVTSATAEVTIINRPRSGSTEWSGTGLEPT